MHERYDYPDYSLVRESGDLSVSKGIVNGVPRYLLWHKDKLADGPFRSAEAATGRSEELIGAMQNTIAGLQSMEWPRVADCAAPVTREAWCSV